MTDSPRGVVVMWRLGVVATLYCCIVAMIWWIPQVLVGKSWREPAEVVSSWLAGLGGHVPGDYPYLTAARSVCVMGIIGLPLYCGVMIRCSVVVRVILVVSGVLFWLAYIGCVILAEGWNRLRLS
jgi:hypothetical protein